MRVLICFIVALFVSVMLRAPTVDAANLTRSGDVTEKEWDEHSPIVYGYLTFPPSNDNSCHWEGDGDLGVIK